ncbi:hypothetical protein AB0D16_04375 [Streptomyces sp. NPDC048161]|uniref:hypothetical protein n=2 Tax=unclassified Streptomyces TaxID=2593676 RepID=UPI00114D2DFC|nr:MULTISPECIES: hypothetical protein [unclassified Streptomyces]MYQ89602.1 hypothetical protein [Streptomyces sp. SID4936]
MAPGIGADHEHGWAMYLDGNHLIGLPYTVRRPMSVPYSHWRPGPDLLNSPKLRFYPVRHAQMVGHALAAGCEVDSGSGGEL